MRALEFSKNSSRITVKSLIYRSFSINFDAHERTAASGKALTLKKDRAFIRYFSTHSALSST